jgi:hypothetical protein
MIFRKKRSDEALLKAGNYSEFIDQRIGFIKKLISHWKKRVKSNKLLSKEKKEQLYLDGNRLLEETDDYAAILKRIGILLSNIGSRNLRVTLMHQVKDIEKICISIKHVCENIHNDLSDSPTEMHSLSHSIVNIHKEIISSIRLIPAMVSHCNNIYDDSHKKEFLRDFKIELHILFDVSNEEAEFVKKVA